VIDRHCLRKSRNQLALDEMIKWFLGLLAEYDHKLRLRSLKLFDTTVWDPWLGSVDRVGGSTPTPREPYFPQQSAREVGRRWQRLPDSIESCSRGHGLEEDQMAAKKQKRQTAATGMTTKPKPKKKTSRGK